MMGIKRASQIALLTYLFILMPHAMAAVPDDWKKTPYAHEASNRMLRDVLEDFAHTVGLQLQIDGSLQGVVNGKLRADTLPGFLDRLGLEHRFQWFVYNNTLYISSLDQQRSARLEVAQDTVADLKTALSQIGLLDERFGWGELPDIGVVLVSGPRRYIEQIRQFSRKRAEATNKQDVLTFALQFANAADRQIDYRGEKLTVPGIASLLRGLLDPKSPTPLALEPDRASPIGSLGASFSNTSTTPAPKTALAPTSTSNIRVEADVRNNSVLIYDTNERRALYQSLIAELDVPRKLVEIDAVILDINRTQLKELGVNWGFQNSRFRAGTGNLSGNNPSTVNIARFDRFVADVKALEERGLATVVSNPSIMTLENQPAVIDFNRTQYIKAVGDGVANILPVTTGTSFQVIPRVIAASGANQIHLIIDIEDGAFANNAGPNSTPDVRQGKVSTQAVISEQQSLVIGGFHVAEEADNRNQVPWLGSIPWLGKALFSSTQSTNNRRERLFILTPRLIGDQTNPVRYLPQSDQAVLEAALSPLARRGAQHPPVINRTDVAQALAHLVTGRIPAHFKAMPMPARTGIRCNTPDFLRVDPDRRQWFESAHYNVAVLVLHNRSQSRVRIDESECSNTNTLAVSVWPRPWLAPGEQAEVFIATRPPDQDELKAVPRPSLLTPAQSASQ